MATSTSLMDRWCSRICSEVESGGTIANTPSTPWNTFHQKSGVVR